MPPSACRVQGLGGGDGDMALSWRVEEAELLWAQGQAAMATSLARALLQRALDHAPAAASGSDARVHAERLATLQSTLGRWLAENRRASIISLSSCCMWGLALRHYVMHAHVAFYDVGFETPGGVHRRLDACSGAGRRARARCWT